MYPYQTSFKRSPPRDKPFYTATTPPITTERVDITIPYNGSPQFSLTMNFSTLFQMDVGDMDYPITAAGVAYNDVEPIRSGLMQNPPIAVETSHHSSSVTVSIFGALSEILSQTTESLSFLISSTTTASPPISQSHSTSNTQNSPLNTRATANGPTTHDVDTDNSNDISPAQFTTKSPNTYTTTAQFASGAAIDIKSNSQSPVEQVEAFIHETSTVPSGLHHITVKSSNATSTDIDLKISKAKWLNAKEQPNDSDSSLIHNEIITKSERSVKNNNNGELNDMFASHEHSTATNPYPLIPDTRTNPISTSQNPEASTMSLITTDFDGETATDLDTSMTNLDVTTTQLGTHSSSVRNLIIPSSSSTADIDSPNHISTAYSSMSDITLKTTLQPISESIFESTFEPTLESTFKSTFEPTFEQTSNYIPPNTLSTISPIVSGLSASSTSEPLESNTFTTINEFTDHSTATTHSSISTDNGSTMDSLRLPTAIPTTDFDTSPMTLSNLIRTTIGPKLATTSTQHSPIPLTSLETTTLASSIQKYTTPKFATIVQFLDLKSRRVSPAPGNDDDTPTLRPVYIRPGAPSTTAVPKMTTDMDMAPITTSNPWAILSSSTEKMSSPLFWRSSSEQPAYVPRFEKRIPILPIRSQPVPATVQIESRSGSVRPSVSTPTKPSGHMPDALKTTSTMNINIVTPLRFETTTSIDIRKDSIEVMSAETTENIPTTTEDIRVNIVPVGASREVSSTYDIPPPKRVKNPNYDFVIYGILPNNTVVRRIPDASTTDSPLVVYGILSNNTVVRKFPNGTIVADTRRSSRTFEVTDIDPKSLFNPNSDLYRDEQRIQRAQLEQYYNRLNAQSSSTQNSNYPTRGFTGTTSNPNNNTSLSNTSSNVNSTDNVPTTVFNLPQFFFVFF